MEVKFIIIIIAFSPFRSFPVSCTIASCFPVWSLSVLFVVDFVL